MIKKTNKQTIWLLISAKINQDYIVLIFLFSIFFFFEGYFALFPINDTTIKFKPCFQFPWFFFKINDYNGRKEIWAMFLYSIFMIKFQYVWHFKTMWVIKYWLKCNTHPQIFTKIYLCPSNFSSFQFNHLSFKTVQLRPLLVLH